MPPRVDPPECRLELFCVRFDSSEALRVRRDLRPLFRGEEPDALARDLAREAAGERRPFVHSTSWRYEDGTVVLTYLAVVAELRDAREVRHLLVDVLEASAGEVPSSSGDPHPVSVLRHGLRHLALLARERPDEVGALLPRPARAALERLLPAPATKADRA